METPYNKQYEVQPEIKFEPLMPKIAEKFPECGNQLMTIDLKEVILGE